MAKHSLNGVLQLLRKMAAVQTYLDFSDGDLLERFVVVQDEAAFTVLIERHGPMVLGVCRRALPNFHDAEDACQATFLVLARKAASVRKKASLGSWLHGVACRVAANLNRDHARRKVREREVNAPAPVDPGTEVTRREAQAILDEELEQLPERYRAPLILCYLESFTREEAARRLGLSSGCLHGRLERARNLLRERLTMRGLTLAAGMCTAALGESVAEAALAPTFVVSSTKAALLFAAGQPLTASVVAPHVLALTHEVLKTMFLTKLKLGTASLLCVGLCVALLGGSFTSLGIAQDAKPKVELNDSKFAIPTAKTESDAPLPAQDRNEAENLFRQMAEKLTKARTFECVFEGKVQPKGILKGSLAFSEGAKVHVEYSLEFGVDRQVKCTVVSDGARVVKVLNGKDPEQVFEARTKDVPLKPQSFREMILRSFGLAGGSTVLELPFFESKVSGFKVGKKETLGGRDTQIIEYEMAFEAIEGASISTAVWLDAKTTLPVKRVARIDKGGGEKYTVTETYSNLTLNKNIDAKKFELPQ